MQKNTIFNSTSVTIMVLWCFAERVCRKLISKPKRRAMCEFFIVFSFVLQVCTPRISSTQICNSRKIRLFSKFFVQWKFFDSVVVCVLIILISSKRVEKNRLLFDNLFPMVRFYKLIEFLSLPSVGSNFFQNFR